MNQIARTRHVEVDALQARIGLRLAARLSEQSRGVPNDIAERLRVAREQAVLRARRPGLIVRRNYPYLGISDGFTTHLRKAFGPRYAGIELEVNQKWVRRPTWPGLQRDLIETLAAIL